MHLSILLEERQSVFHIMRKTMKFLKIYNSKHTSNSTLLASIVIVCSGFHPSLGIPNQRRHVLLVMNSYASMRSQLKLDTG